MCSLRVKIYFHDRTWERLDGPFPDPLWGWPLQGGQDELGPCSGSAHDKTQLLEEAPVGFVCWLALCSKVS